MIAIDTNVLVRFLTADDVRQAKRAREVIGRAIRESTRIFVSDVVVCEVVWVLTNVYKVSRAEVAKMLGDLVRAEHLFFTTVDCMARAVESYARGKGDFADYLIREHAKDAGCQVTLTFDRALLGERGFKAP